MGVKLHVDLETLQLIQGPGQRSAVAALRFKRGDAARLQVVFLENGLTPVAIGNSNALEIQIGIKPRNQFDRSYLAHTADWSMPSEGDDTPAYECALGFNTLQLNSALNLGSATATELSEITLMGEITWREGSAEPTSTRTFLVIVENDVNRGDEGVPDSAEPAYPVPEGIELVARKGVANGYAGLDSGGKVPAAQLAITAASISDSTTTGRALIKATSAASARSTIGAMANPSLSGAPLHGLNQSGSWVGITQGQRAVLYSPYDYASYPLPQFFKGLALYVLDPTYSWYGYTLADLVSYMESYHGGSAFWGQVLTQGTGEWTIPGFAVLNLNGSSPIPVGALFSWPILTSQPGRQNPGSEVYLDPNGMATLSFLNTGIVSIHGDLSTTGGGGYGSY
jgi:hypothetical protein